MNNYDLSGYGGIVLIVGFGIVKENSSKLSGEVRPEAQFPLLSPADGTKSPDFTPWAVTQKDAGPCDKGQTDALMLPYIECLAS